MKVMVVSVMLGGTTEQRAERKRRLMQLVYSLREKGYSFTSRENCGVYSVAFAVRDNIIGHEITEAWETLWGDVKTIPQIYYWMANGAEGMIATLGFDRTAMEGLMAEVKTGARLVKDKAADVAVPPELNARKSLVREAALEEEAPEAKMGEITIEVSAEGLEEIADRVDEINEKLELMLQLWRELRIAVTSFGDFANR